MDAVLGEGIAVIQGHRVTNQFNSTFTIPRAQDTETETNEQIATSFGNFVKVSTWHGGDSGDILGLPNINVLQHEGHSDGCFAILKDGAIITRVEIQNYKKNFQDLILFYFSFFPLSGLG